MKKGFMELVATRLVVESPGKTAEQYAGDALDKGLVFSDARDPVQSLANTLAKQVREGREKRIRRERIDGAYRYFPATESHNRVFEFIFVQVSLDAEKVKHIDNLVSVGAFDDRSRAINWLVEEGIKANRHYLDKVERVINQIEGLKTSVANNPMRQQEGVEDLEDYREAKGEPTRPFREFLAELPD